MGKEIRRRSRGVGGGGGGVKGKLLQILLKY